MWGQCKSGEQGVYKLCKPFPVSMSIDTASWTWFHNVRWLKGCLHVRVPGLQLLGHINSSPVILSLSCCISIGWFVEAEVVICQCDDQNHIQMHSPTQPPTFLTLTPLCVTSVGSQSRCGSCNSFEPQATISWASRKSYRSRYQGKTMTSSGPLPYRTTLFSSSLQHFNDCLSFLWAAICIGQVQTVQWDSWLWVCCNMYAITGLTVSQIHSFSYCQVSLERI